MANQPEQVQYDAGVYQLETTDPVDGGVGAVSNKPLLNLANRTAYLKQHVDNLENGTTIPPTVAPLNSPAFTGSPTAPTAPLGDNSTKLATDAFVQGTVNGVSTINVAGNSNVTLTAVQAGAGILVFTGALTGNISVIVPNTSAKWEISNQTTGAFTLTVKTAAGTGILVAQGKNTMLWCDGTNVLDAKTDFPSPALTGNPTAPTAASGDSSTSIANTGFVFNATDGMATVNVAGNVDVTLTQAQYGCALLNLTGALTGNINLKFPQLTGQWVVANNSTGAFAITGKTTAAGTPATVVLPQGSAVIVYSDGTNMFFASNANSQVSFTRTQFNPTAGTTTLTVPTGYTPGAIFIEKNGAVLQAADFTATNGSTITLTSATSTGDVINVYAFKTFTVANAVQKSGDVMSGPLALAGGDTGATQALSDNSTKLATTAWGWLLGNSVGKNMQAYASAGTFSFTVPANVTSILAYVTGGGGGGSGCQSPSAFTTASGGGGGAGGTAIGVLTVTPGQVLTVVVGAGANGSVGTGASGGSGGTSSVGGISATGGTGSAFSSGSSGSGVGGVGSGGIINLHGSLGTTGQQSGSTNMIFPGIGGSSIWGGGGPNFNSASGPFTQSPGAGGGGAFDLVGSNTVKTGASGAPGIVVLQW